MRSTMHRRDVVAGLGLAVVLAVAAPAFAQGAKLQLPGFEGLAQKAKESVDVTLDASMLQLASGLMTADDPDGAAVKRLIQDIKGIYVKHFEFDRPGAYSQSDVDAVRAQLAKTGWTRLVGVRSTERSGADLDASDTEVFAWLDEKGVPGGLALVSSEPTEFTIVNVVGRIDLDKLRQLEGQFGIPKVPIPPTGAAQKPKPE